MYFLYKALTGLSGPALSHVLQKRLSRGKEHPQRYIEKQSVITKERPQGNLIWLHAASVGEVQSSLILINKILKFFPELNILVTTGTITSAELISKKLPQQAFHQFYPLDHPKWTESFLDHWKPQTVLWMESEIWPNMLKGVRDRKIPAYLINAHLSEKSYSMWRYMKRDIRKILSAFTHILCQTDKDKNRYTDLGAENVTTTDNLKYSAVPLQYDDAEFAHLKEKIRDRKLWLYASSHKGEEELVARIHNNLKTKYPDILSIIAPRHPERSDDIQKNLKSSHLNITVRGNEHKLPNDNTDIYLADTLGELGLFYALCPLACIGRSFSDDGGGGHNPIEAALLNCAILHGPNVQNLQDIFDEMNVENVAIKCHDEQTLEEQINQLLGNDFALMTLQKNAKNFAEKKSHVIDIVMEHIRPALQNLHHADKG